MARIYPSVVKPTFDFCAAGIALVLLSPLLVVIAVGIKLSDRGPVLYWQRRVGQAGVCFRVCKFRTMVSNAPDLRNPDGTTFNSSTDPRVFAFGRLLRRSSLDELMQLWNVVKGEMSIVGPRPELPESVQEYRPHQRKRLDVRPGLTGWAVIHGRNNVPLDRRRDLDAWYSENLGFILDIRIIARTVLMVITGEGVVAERFGETN